MVTRPNQRRPHLAGDRCRRSLEPAALVRVTSSRSTRCMFVLELGRAVVLKSWQGKDYALHTLKVGDWFGEMGLMDRCPRSASVRAAEDCSAIRISPADLHQVYVRDLKQFALM